MELTWPWIGKGKMRTWGGSVVVIGFGSITVFWGSGELMRRLVIAGGIMGGEDKERFSE